MVRRSQRQAGQKPVNCSSGWRSQLKEDLVGGGGGRSAEMGFITTTGNQKKATSSSPPGGRWRWFVVSVIVVGAAALEWKRWVGGWPATAREKTAGKGKGKGKGVGFKFSRLSFSVGWWVEWKLPLCPQ